MSISWSNITSTKPLLRIWKLVFLWWCCRVKESLSPCILLLSCSHSYTSLGGALVTCITYWACFFLDELDSLLLVNPPDIVLSVLHATLCPCFSYTLQSLLVIGVLYMVIFFFLHPDYPLAHISDNGLSNQLSISYFKWWQSSLWWPCNLWYLHHLSVSIPITLSLGSFGLRRIFIW